MISVLWLSSECDKQRSQTSESGVCILHRYPPYRLIMAWNGGVYHIYEHALISLIVQVEYSDRGDMLEVISPLSNPPLASHPNYHPWLCELCTWQDNESVSMTHICSEHALQSQICWRVTRRLKKKKPNLIAERIPANTEANSYFTHQKTASENWIKCPQNPQNPHKRLLPL